MHRITKFNEMSNIQYFLITWNSNSSLDKYAAFSTFMWFSSKAMPIINDFDVSTAYSRPRGEKNDINTFEIL